MSCVTHINCKYFTLELIEIASPVYPYMTETVCGSYVLILGIHISTN